MHKWLYRGILKPYYPRFLSHKGYLPHMTIGRFNNRAEINKVAAHYRTMNEIFEELVTEISVEIIDEHENSTIEMTLDIKGSEHEL